MRLTVSDHHIDPPKLKKAAAKAETAKRMVKNERAKARSRIQNAKKTIEKDTAKLERLKTAKTLVEGEKPVIIEQETLQKLAPTVQSVVDQREVIFKPNPGPQTDFLASSETEVFYGGARGGGKTYSLIIDPLRYCHKQKHRALFLRRTMPELRDIINHTQQLYPKAFPGAKWREQEKEWRFPSGARIEFGYAETRTDALRYQGQAYSWIGIDELPQYPDEAILNDLTGSLRSVDPDIPTYLRATGNPGNIGSPWVKARYIDAAPSNTRFYREVKMPDGSIDRTSIRYIPATVYDNPYLTYDNSYIRMLASLPEYQRKQWLEGNWDVYEGAAFPEFDKSVHVVDPFPIPASWRKFRAADWGYSSPACVLWFAVDFDNNLYVYRELYTKGLTADVFARKVLDLEYEDNISYGVLDASTWANRGEIGPSIAETMNREGCRWRPSGREGNSRKNGKLEIHRRLTIFEDPHNGLKTSKLKIFSNCTNLIRTLPILPLADNNPEDIDTDVEDHAYDALRYGVMSRPLAIETPFDLRAPTRSGDFIPASSVFGY